VHNKGALGALTLIFMILYLGRLRARLGRGGLGDDAEIFPLKARAAGMGVGAVVLWASTGIVTAVFPIISDKNHLGLGPTMWVFAGIKRRAVRAGALADPGDEGPQPRADRAGSAWRQQDQPGPRKSLIVGAAPVTRPAPPLRRAIIYETPYAKGMRSGWSSTSCVGNLLVSLAIPVTPFDKHDQLDEPAYAGILTRLVDGGIEVVTPNGKHRRVLRAVRRRDAPGRRADH